jgi:DNA-binding PadR family transcriptional regulator
LEIIILNTEHQNPGNLLPLTPAVFHILVALADADLHGYAIMKEVEARTEGRLLLKPGTLYQAISRLLEAGLIEEVEVRGDDHDERRRVYRLSSSGRQAVIAEARRLEQMVKQAYRKNILEEGKSSFVPVI